MSSSNQAEKRHVHFNEATLNFSPRVVDITDDTRTQMNSTKRQRSECLVIQEEEAAIETILENVGVEKNGRKSIAKVVYCFWNLGPGWHTYAELSRVYSAHWPYAGDTAISRVRDGCKHFNTQVSLSGNGSSANHDSNCTRKSIHAICQRNPATYSLEPYLEALVNQACTVLSYPLSPPREPRQKRLRHTVKRNSDLSNGLATSTLECDVMDRVRKDACDVFHKEAQAYIAIMQQMTQRLTHAEREEARKEVLIRRNGELAAAYEMLKQKYEDLRRREAAGALASLQNCH